MHFTIVSYTFPPSKDIGGRRWAKFSRHLASVGHEVTVVCANNIVDTDFYKREYPEIDVKAVPTRYPSWLSGHTKSYYEKIFYFMMVRIYGLFTRRNLFDRGFAWKKEMLSTLENIHRNKKIDVLIATGAPFSLLYYGSIFKKRHPDVFYISDFRDPWTWVRGYYGFDNISPNKRRYQEFQELNTITTSDMICCPIENMGEHLRKKYPSFSTKVYLLPHAYEPNKFPEKDEEDKKTGFVYGGTLYAGIEDAIKNIMKVLGSFPGSGFQWKIYTSTPYPLLEDPASSNGHISKQAFVPEEQLFREIKNSAAYLAIFPETDKDLISTKFFEIIYAGTPILYIGEEGEVAKFIRNNRVGVHILPSNIEKELPQYLTGNVPFEPGYFDVSQYSFQTVTDNFLQEIERLKSKTIL